MKEQHIMMIKNSGIRQGAVTIFSLRILYFIKQGACHVFDSDDSHRFG